MKQYRADMPEIPDRIKGLPTQEGYPIPYFVEEPQVEGDRYDFRITSRAKMVMAVKKKLCWVCGQKLGAHLAFPLGPMCSVNRTIAEPPSHRECAEWTAKACPFLSQRQMVRRDVGLPENVILGPGVPIMRQPGVTCIWITKSYKPFKPPGGGVLFTLGEPTEVLWFREGRPATRAEVLESIESGIPLLMELAEAEGPSAIALLGQMKTTALELIPKD